jgi:dienelactone hydrolase
MIFPMITGAPVCFKDIYNAALEADNEKDNKLIPAQNVKANILMIVGEDDQMMNTYEMAKLIQSQNDNAVLHSYKNAGHIFSGDGVAIEFDMRIRLGGDIDGNRRASEECATVINDFLSSHHGK